MTQQEAYVTLGAGSEKPLRLSRLLAHADHGGVIERCTVGDAKIGHWRPPPASNSSDARREALTSLGDLDLLIYTAWRYDSTAYLDNLWALADAFKAEGKGTHLAVADFDLPHLKLLIGSDYPIVANMVAASLLDERHEELAHYCKTAGVALIGYGATLGGFLSEEWVGKPEPTDLSTDGGEDSLGRWKRVIDAAGGWAVFQGVLAAVSSVAKKHQTSCATVAIRAILDSGIDAVSLSPAEAKAEGILELQLDADDRCALACATADAPRLPGGCGDDLRFAPFLTASGRLPAAARMPYESEAKRAALQAAIDAGSRAEYMSGSPWEPVVGYCRAVRHRDRIVVSGTTTKPHPSGQGVIGADAEDQATFVFDIIRGAVDALGGTLADVVRTRILYAEVERDWLSVGRVQEREINGRYGVLPTNTMVGGLTYVVGRHAVLEIEAECVMGAKGTGEVFTISAHDE